MTRYIPTLRGGIAFVLGAFSVFYFPVLRPALMVESGGEIFVAERVTTTVWVTGAALIFACLLACVEAFRRGSWPDKWFAGMAVLLTLILALQYFELVILSIHKSPNHARQRTSASRHRCNRRASWPPPSLSMGR